MPRPALPYKNANPHIKQIDNGTLPPVKYQILNCQGKDILVGRMKILTPTQSGHAFILRRFDTGAISLTTMFRAAFPSASEQEEKRETAWVKDNYDLTGNNGSSKEHSIIRLAGTWVSPDVAVELGAAYSLGDIIPAVAKATPDPNANYRRSGKAITPKATPSAPTSTSSPAATTAAPSPAAALPNPPKRRKEQSPAPIPVSPRSPSPTPARSPAVRRSARTKSPTPKPAPASFSPIKSPKVPKTPKSVRRSGALTPGQSDETAVEEDAEVEAADLAGQDLRHQDIAEQKEMIENLKAQRDALMQDGGEEDNTIKQKRARETEEPQLQFDFKEPEVEERAIATNRRVSRFRLEPRQKSVAWGLAAFAVGLSAVTFLPNFF
jgi:hypothetical protein